MMEINQIRNCKNNRLNFEVERQRLTLQKKQNNGDSGCKKFGGRREG